MEVCQFCEMYMKPFISDGNAKCEFCGEIIAKVVNKRWVKTPTHKDKPERGKE